MGDPESVGNDSLIKGKPHSKAKCISWQNIEVKAHRVKDLHNVDLARIPD
jgi:hypothetical protein